MKVFFNPAYTNFVYQNLEKNSLRFDQKVCNTEGLLDLLELHAGIHTSIKDEMGRRLEYCKAMAKYIEENVQSIFAASYNIDAYNTAKQCLKWRDAFIMSGWNGEANTGSKRLDELSGIEKYFKLPSSAERIKVLIKAIKEGCNLPDNLEIITPFDYKYFSPYVKELLEALADRKDKTVKISSQVLPEGNSYLRQMADILINCKKDALDLRKSDGSVAVWLFEEKNDALRYLSQLEDDSFKVWINRDNKTFDNYLSFVGKPTCGSEDNGVTVLGSIPFLTLKLLEKPLNLTSLVTYLGLFVSPFSKEFRKELQETITSSGGYYNDDCKEIIAKAEKEDADAVKKFLPDIEDIENALNEDFAYTKDYLATYIGNISAWLSSYLTNEQIISGNRVQLEASKKICSYMLALLDISNKTSFTYQELMILFENLSADIKTEIYPGEKACRNIINSPSNFAEVSESTIWCDFYNPDEEVLSTSFMYPSEKKYLEKTLWKDEIEKTYNRYNELLPFLYTDKKLILVIVKKQGTADVTKNPVIIRLMKNMKMDENKFYGNLKKPDITKLKGVKVLPSSEINNHKQDEHGLVHFTRTDLINFRETESYSSITNLIENPFDYVMEKHCGFSMSGEAAMNAVYTTKGTVAHAIIEELFNPKHGGTAADIKKQIETRFEEVCNQKILEEGGILLQKENKSDTDIFRALMKECVNRLQYFIEINNLKVKACEQKHEKEELAEFSACGINFTGSIDMVLEDDSGKPVIFDFKYSGGFKKYQEMLKENRSMQLELYNALVKHSLGLNQSDCRRAYVLLPEVKVITQNTFEGAHYYIRCERPHASLINEMKNSYLYRRNQILNGEVEDGEYIELEKLDYYSQINDENNPLVPLGKDEKEPFKAANKYSKYASFKAGK